MGYDAVCTLHYDGRSSTGKAMLEQCDLTFRGPVRLAIPLKDIASAVASEGRLTVTFGRRRAVFEIGPSAARWAERIRNPPSRLDKLGVKPGMSVLMAGTRHADLTGEVSMRGARLLRRAGRGTADIVFCGVDDRVALEAIVALKLKAALKPNGSLWIIRPKGSAAIAEAEVMEAGKRIGLVDVKVVSFSAVYTAEKFVIPRSAR